MSMYRDIEKVFLHTPHRVVSTFAVVKCTPCASSTKSKSKRQGGGPRSTRKPRVLCVTVQRRAAGPGFKTSLHVCKGGRGSYEIRKSFRLKSLVKMEAFDEAGNPHPMFQLTFVGRTLAMGETKIAFETMEMETRTDILRVLYSFCRSHEKRKPVLVGIQENDLGLYGDDSEEDEMGNVQEHEEEGRSEIEHVEKSPMSQKDVTNGDLKSGVQGLGMVGKVGAAEKESIGVSDQAIPRSSTVPRKNSVYQDREKVRADVLLDAVAEGASSLEDACTKVSLELNAIHDANIHELLESYKESSVVHDGIFTTLGYIDDLEETIGMFDMKLRHLKQSMAEIEESSGYLEHHSRNNLLLLGAMDNLLKYCTIDPEVRRIILHENLSGKSIEKVLRVAEDLHKRKTILQGSHKFNDSGFAPEFLDMKVTKECLEEIIELEKRFVIRAVDYFDTQVIGASECYTLSTDDGHGIDMAQMKIHEKVNAAAPVLKMISKLDMKIAEDRVMVYIQKINAALRKRLSVLLEECNGSVFDATPVKDLMARVDSVTALERLQTCQKSPLSASPDKRDAQEVHKLGIGEVFDKTLNVFIPMVLNELTVLVDLVNKSGTSCTSDLATANLLHGISPEFSTFISSIKPSYALSSLRISASISEWLQKVPTNTISGKGVHRFLEPVQGQCENFWQSFAKNLSKAIRRYESHTAKIRGGSAIHILPFVINFESLSTKIEAIVTEWVAKDGDISRVTSTRSDNSSLLPSPFQSVELGSEEANQSSESLHVNTKDHMYPGELLRKMADDFYLTVLPEIYGAVEYHASSHERHGQRIRLENYAFLRISLQSLPLKRASLLREYCTKAADQRNAALKLYIDEVIQDSKLSSFHRFTDATKDLNSTNKMIADANLILQCTESEIEAALQSIKSKLEKELGVESPYLVGVALERIELKCLKAIEQLEKQFPAEVLAKGSWDFRALFSKSQQNKNYSS